MCSLPFLTCGVLALSRSLPARWALALAVVIVLLQAPSAYTALALSVGPATGRNFVEYYDSPLIFPIKSLMAEAQTGRCLAAAGADFGQLN